MTSLSSHQPAHRAASAEVIPRRAVMGGFLALAMSVGGVLAVRLSGTPIREPDAETVASRRLRFDDLADGGIAVVDVDSGATLEVLHGEQGFLRGTLRGLVRSRKLRGLTSSEPLHLLGRADGRLTLFDPLTAERIDLESFGPSNLAVYARWLAEPGQTTGRR